MTLPSFCKHVHSFTRYDTKPVPTGRLPSSSAEHPDRISPVVVTYFVRAKITGCAKGNNQ